MLHAWVAGETNYVVRRLLLLSALVAGPASASTMGGRPTDPGPAAVAVWTTLESLSSHEDLRAASLELQYAQTILGQVDFEVDPVGEGYLAALHQILDWAEAVDLSKHALALAQHLASARATFLERTQSFDHWRHVDALRLDRDFVPIPQRFIRDIEIEELPLPDFEAIDLARELLA